MSKWHLVQQQPLLREILKEPIISYRNKCSLRHTRERKLRGWENRIYHGVSCKYLWLIQRKLDVLLNHLSMSTSIYTGALIKPVSKAKKYFLWARLYLSQPLSRLRIGVCPGLAFLSSSRISPLKNLVSQIAPRFWASSCILPNLYWTLSTAFIQYTGFNVGFNTLSTQKICGEHVKVVKNVLITFITKMQSSLV